MNPVTILVLADTQTHGDLGRVVNALSTAKEFKASGDEVALIFEGAGTRAAVQLADPEHQLHAAFKEVDEVITGICRFCAQGYQVAEQAEAAGFTLLSGDHQHPSVRNFLVNGYEVINF